MHYFVYFICSYLRVYAKISVNPFDAKQFFLQLYTLASFAVKPQSICAFAAQQLFVGAASMMLNLLLSKGRKDFAVTAQNLHC